MEQRLIEVVEYQKEWILNYKEVSEEIQKCFPCGMVELYHMGSTSVSGLMAKPLLDILGVVNVIDDVDTYKEKMEEIGFEAKGEWGLLRRRFFQRKGDVPVNFHIFESTNFQSYKHLIFCEYLRHHPQEKEDYGKLKANLAAKFPHDITSYLKGKGGFVRETNAKAIRWWYEFHGPLVLNKNYFPKDKRTEQNREDNIHAYMLYLGDFAKDIELIGYPDMTLIRTKVKDDSFNYGVRFNFSPEDCQERIENIEKTFDEEGLPYSLWIAESHRPQNLIPELAKKGFKIKEVNKMMALEVENSQIENSSTKLMKINRVETRDQLTEFAFVYDKLLKNSNPLENAFLKVPLSAILEGMPLEYYVAYDENGLPVTTGSLFSYGGVASLWQIMTIPDQRKKGYGRGMLSFLLERAKNLGFDEVCLLASEEGVSLYEKMGFEVLGNFVEYSKRS